VIVAIRGGTMFPRIVVQAEARRFLDEFGIAYTEYEGEVYVADSIESVCWTCASAIGAGAKIFNLVSIEDVMIREDRCVPGLVVTDPAIKRLSHNWIFLRNWMLIFRYKSLFGLLFVVTLNCETASKLRGISDRWG